MVRPNSGIPLDQWSGSGATDRLHETIREFTDASNAQTATMIRLTRALVVLTVLLFAGLVVQIVLALTA